MTTYKLLFSPELRNPRDPDSDLVLTPVIVSEDGGNFAMKKTVKTVKQAFMFDAGFTLAQFIEEEGGPEGIKAMLDSRGEAGALSEQKEADLLAGLSDEPAAPTVEDGLLDPDEGC